jgi:hypothetical protein
MTRVWGVAALAALIVTTLGCKDEGPTAGNLSVRLTSPNSGADSAIVFTVTGPAPLTSVTAGPGFRAFHQALGGNSTKIALTGRLLNNGVLVTIGVANVQQVGQYAGTIQGIAQPSYQLRVSLGGYSLAVVR